VCDLKHNTYFYRTVLHVPTRQLIPQNLVSNTLSCPLEVASSIDVAEEAGRGVAVADMVQEGWAVWGWELANDLFEFCVPGGVSRPGP